MSKLLLGVVINKKKELEKQVVTNATVYLVETMLESFVMNSRFLRMDLR